MTALSVFFGVLMFVTSLFLVLLVLVQRGRGGGLSGALGGMGGQSAFGTKAGDLFTKITMYVATFWILLCIAAILVLNRQSSPVLDKRLDSPEYRAVAPSSSADKKDTSKKDANATGATAKPKADSKK